MMALQTLTRPNMATTIIALLATITLVSGLLVLAVLHPPRIIPGSADAVFVFAGDHDDHRLAAAVDLIANDLSDQQPPPTLVVSHGSRRGRTRQQLDHSCAAIGETVRAELDELDELDELRVTCIVPDPINTSGEAAAFAQLARDSGWTKVVGVSSSYHAARVRLWLSFCTRNVDVRVVGATTVVNRQRITHEIGGLLYAYARPSCPPPTDTDSRGPA